jgi:uncharacterized LabA/DUF88 family protein
MGSVEVAAPGALGKHNPYREQLRGLKGEELAAVARRLRQQVRDDENHFMRKFNGWQTVQDGICHNHKGVEFRRAGAISYNLFTHQLGQEKAVDVRLAVDLLTLCANYDLAVIVSGDQDYVPAVQAVKDRGKRVVNVAFLERRGRLLPGGARRLNQITDDHIAVPYDQSAEYFLGVPNGGTR